MLFLSSSEPPSYYYRVLLGTIALRRAFHAPPLLLQSRARCCRVAGARPGGAERQCVAARALARAFAVLPANVGRDVCQQPGPAAAIRRCCRRHSIL